MGELSMSANAIRCREQRARERGEKPKRAWTPLTPEQRALPVQVRDREKRIQDKRRAREAEAQQAGRVLQVPSSLKQNGHVLKWLQMSKQSQRKHNAHVVLWRHECPAAHARHKYRTCPKFNARVKLKARLRKTSLDGEIAAYMANSLKKSGLFRKWLGFLGYGTDELVARLMSTLPPGATWHDFLSGALHIDHIKPRSRFDLTNPAEARACWALSNLQLLWAADTIKKGAAWDAQERCAT